MATQEQYILVKKANGDVGITQNSVEVFTSINTSAVANTLCLKEGKIGIGVATPNSKLTVHGIAQIGGGGTDASLGDSIIFYNTAYLTSYFNKIRNSHSAAGSQSIMTFELSTGASTTLEVLSLVGNGNVGIGITNPSRQLVLYATRYNYIALQNDATGNTAGDGFQIQQNNLSTYFWNYEAGIIAFATNNVQRMTILSTGEIGIGLDSPACKLHVQATVIGSPLVKIRQTSATGYGLAIVPGADTYEALYINDSTDSSSNIVMFGSGKAAFLNNVGIGVNPATSRLHVKVASAGNVQSLLVEQLDTTNNPACAEINNDGTSHGLYIHQDGINANDKYALYVYSNAVQTYQSYRGLATFKQDNSSASEDVIDIWNDGTGIGLRIWQGNTGNVFVIENEGTGVGAYINQVGVLESGKYGLYVYSNAAQVNSALAYFWMNNNSATTSVIEIDNHGTGHSLLLLHPVYDDIQFPIASGKLPAANYPTWEAFTTNTSEYAFSVDDYIDCQANELAHWWKQGTAGHIHLHFTIKTAQSTGQNRFVKFSIWVAYADTDEVWVEQAVLSAEKTIPTGSGALKAFYLDIGDATLTNYLIGGQVKLRVKRIAATGGTEYADDVYITQVGMHLEKDTLGSRTETVK